ncbi:hypothetical protein P872_13085 [Rhodonellum psychrophilum GCM71 = DSM 17998]|uniref:Uncharacterized protein n=1 Tax=Rhodonellum psychrophilum GCM71 = DSM 17998 TaxID=1123057 RepID=U5BRI8_9BACT|nr:hypothetical protein P872_13085 [Rhodonellum psychrophilum GCM71 = DSM 17998]
MNNYGIDPANLGFVEGLPNGKWLFLFQKSLN